MCIGHESPDVGSFGFLQPLKGSVKVLLGLPPSSLGDTLVIGPVRLRTMQSHFQTCLKVLSDCLVIPHLQEQNRQSDMMMCSKVLCCHAIRCCEIQRLLIRSYCFLKMSLRDQDFC